jgi:protein SCO1
VPYRMTGRLLTVIAFAILLGSTSFSRATVDRNEIGQIEATPGAGVALPLDLPLEGEAGKTMPLQQWLGGTPSLWILADYTCETLCGPVISIVADALASSGLKAGADFRLVVVGLDPKDSAVDAAAMKRAQVGSEGDLVTQSYFLRTSAASIAELTRALGFRSRYERDHDQFAHPAAVFVVTPNGHIARALSPLALDTASLRLAVLEAGRGQIGSLADHVRLICYGFDPVSGTYSLAVGRLLAGTGMVTIIALALLVAVLFRRERLTRAG